MTHEEWVEQFCEEVEKLTQATIRFKNVLHQSMAHECRMKMDIKRTIDGKQDDDLK